MMKSANKNFLKPISSGVFIASIILIIFSALLSYQQEAGALVTGMLALSLLFIGKSSSAKTNNIFSTIIFFTVPLFFSFIIIKGDGRSWFLILLATLTCWLILFNKTNDEK